MWGQLYALFHDIWAVCFWTPPAFLVGLLMIVTGLVHWRNQRKREKDFVKEQEERLEGKIGETISA